MPQFAINLKNEKIRLYNRLSWLIIIINLLLLLYFGLTASTRHEMGGYFITIIACIICFLLKIYFRNSKYAFGFAPFFFFIMFGWAGAERYWLAAITFLFEMLSINAFKEFVLRFSADGISYPSFFSKKIKWSDLNNCLVKDGLLTIDFKNNKIIQQILQENTGINKFVTTEPTVEKFESDEQEFNDFCKRQLAASHT